VRGGSTCIALQARWVHTDTRFKCQTRRAYVQSGCWQGQQREGLQSPTAELCGSCAHTSQLPRPSAQSFVAGVDDYLTSKNASTSFCLFAFL
jgi:hypothetical protein